MKLKIAFSGTHGTGKTTSVLTLAKELKIKNPDKSVGILIENASWSPYKINKQTTEESQLWIFSNQMSKELEYLSKYDILVTDRTVVDAIAYTVVAKFNDLAYNMFKLAKHYIQSYDKIIFKTIENNDYLVDDGVRDGKDREFRQNIELKLLSYYNVLVDDVKLLDKYKFKIE